MDHLSCLPEELTCDIVRWVPHQSLPALASVSHQLHRLVIPRLYRCVYYKDFNGCDRDRDNEGSPICANSSTAIRSAGGDRPLCQPSRIFRLDCFLETIITRPEIRSHITTVGFESFKTGFEAIDNIVSEIIDLILPSLQTLDISPVFYRFDPATETTLRSLKICHETRVLRDHTNTHMFPMFRIPTLRNLSIEIVAGWQPSRLLRHPQQPADRSRSKTSNVTSLSFPTGVPYGDDLMEMLSWPKALEVFELGPPLDHIKTIFTHLLSPRKLVEALRCQQHSLRELYITDYPYKHTMTKIDDATLGDLHNFGGLNRLCVPKQLLVVSDEHKEPTFKHSQTPPQIWEILPPTIEELRLETAPYYRWLFKSVIPIGDEAKELEKCLSEIAKHKRLQYPNLQEVVVWQPRLPETFQGLTLKRLHEMSGLLESFNESEMRLLFSRDPEPSALGRIEISEFSCELA